MADPDWVAAMGRVYPSHGSWRDRGIIRVSICAYSTTDEVISALIADVKDAWQQVSKDMKAGVA
jgi:hypothetical protein